MRQSPVSPEEGRAMAEKINAFGYLECSGEHRFRFAISVLEIQNLFQSFPKSPSDSLDTKLD